MSPKSLFIFSICIAFLFVHTARCHSWVACTDYKIASDADREIYDPSKCAGFPRNWQNYAADLGVDRGYDYQATDAAACQDPLGSPTDYGYPAQFPMAQYYPGQRVCLAWPTKNHVAATCTNPYIPDNGLEIFASGPNPTVDPTLTQFKQNVIEPAVNGIHQNGVIDWKGFQNCPRFCDNMDKSLCTGCFNVPANFQVGSVYTFQWYWVFNAGTPPYTTCWEAKIVSNGTASSGSATSSSSSSSSSTAQASTSSGSSTSGSATSGSSSTTGGSSSSQIKYKGVNIAVAEFGSNVPGTFGTDYSYPTKSEFDYFSSKGMNTIRLPFLWERVQRTLGGELDSDEIKRLDEAVDYATNTHSLYVILDPHNYARYSNNIIGAQGSSVTQAHFKDFWSKMAQRYKDNSRIIFGLMNEPNNMDTDLWLSDANAAIAAIRATGATNLILVPGNAWTGGHSWLKSVSGQKANGDVMAGVVDSGNNFMFEIHQYLDSDSSGTSSTCTSATIGSERLGAVTDWMRTRGYKALLGEFGAAANQVCLSALTDMLSYMETNSDVWNGWTYWAAGPWWGSYMFSIEPTGTAPAFVDQPQMTAMLPFLSSSSDSTSSTSSSTGTSSTTGDSGSGNDIVNVAKITDTVPRNGTFRVEVGYSVSATRQIVVQVFQQGGEHGKGVATVSGSGSVLINVTIGVPLTNTDQVVIVVTLVPNGKANTPNANAIDSATTEASVDGAINNHPSMSSGVSLSASFGVCLLVLVALLF